MKKYLRNIAGLNYIWISIGLLLGTFGMKYIISTLRNTPKHFAGVVEQKLAEEIQSTDATMTEVIAVLKEKSLVSFRSLDFEVKYPVYIFVNSRVVYWTGYQYTPKYRDIEGNFQYAYIESSTGKYIARKERLKTDSREYEAVILIPLISTAKVVNKYLKSEFNKKIFADKNIEISKVFNDQAGEVVAFHNTPLFRIKFGNTYSEISFFTRTVLISGIMLALGLLVVFIYIHVHKFIAQREYMKGFMVLVISLPLIRLLMLKMSFPFSLVQLDLFNPKFYASSLANPSLGDFILNLFTLGILGYYAFKFYPKFGFYNKLYKSEKSVKQRASIILIFMSYFWLTLHHQAIRTLNYDSQWSMDITNNLEFDYIKIFGFFSFVLSVVVYFLFTHVCFKIFIRLNRGKLSDMIINIFIGTALFVLLALLMKWDLKVVITVNLAFFILAYIFRLSSYVGRIQYLTFIYLFSYGLPGALVGLYANYQYNISEDNNSKSRLASSLLVESDLFTEFLLADASEKISEDVFIQNRIFNPYASKSFIEQKIRRVYLNNLDQYDIEVYVFNSKGDPFESFNTGTNVHDLKSQLSEYKTSHEGLFFINQAKGTVANWYRAFIEIKNYGRLAGYVLLDLKLKSFVPNSVYPLLLFDNRFSQDISANEKFSYGVFKGGDRLYNFGDFNYSKNMVIFRIDSVKLFSEGIVREGYKHKGYRMEQGDKYVIITSKIYPVRNLLTNFSFLFMIYILHILLLLIVITMYLSFRHMKQNYATRIQLYLNFAFFAPLILISVTTVSIIVQTFKNELDNQYINRARNVSVKIAGALGDYKSQYMDRESLKNEIYNVAEFAGMDINLFNTNGYRLASSQPMIYENEILSNNINPKAYISIIEELESSVIMQEQVGTLNYKCVYIGVKSFDTGTLTGILSIPFFASKLDLEQNIIQVLANILDIFTFVFVAFIFVSFFVSKGLTFPLRLITQKIKRTTLSGYNEPLSWNSDDEIGMMVSEYNKMLINLEESKEALARSEKESAWREMARQVAHEIKNPLTPMKLTLQHMKRKLEIGDEDMEETKQKQINSLLQQIETLSDIATSFSAYAKMPTPQINDVDVAELVKETIELYNKKELGTIELEHEEDRYHISGDRNWLGQALSNIIINGFQAAQNKGNPEIRIRLYKKDENNLMLEIIDNGDGIPENVRDKVFVPNFSTKFTGSGIGLAISKRAVEHAGGRIWFDSTDGEGTTFYIEIPCH